MEVIDINGQVIPTLSPTMRVAIGDIHLPLLTLVGKGGRYYFCTHEKGFPPIPATLKGDKGYMHKGNCRFKRIDSYTFNTALEGIKLQEKVGGYHINPHSFLVGWCLARGVDLYKEDLLEM